jgi:hypothetical protein
MKISFSRKVNSGAYKDDEGITSFNTREERKNLFVSDIQAGDLDKKKYFEGKNIERNKRGLSDSLIQPFFFNSNWEKSIFDSGSQIKNDQDIKNDQVEENFKIKSFDYSEETEIEDLPNEKIINLRRRKRKNSFDQGKPILSSFSASARNIFRNSRYRDAIGDSVKKKIDKPKKKVNFYSEKNLKQDQKPISLVKRKGNVEESILEKKNIKDSLKEIKKRQDKSVKNEPNLSLYEEYEKRIKVLRKNDFLDEEQKEKIRKRKEAIRFAREKKKLEARERKLKIEKERILALRKKEQKAREEEKIKLEKRKALILREKKKRKINSRIGSQLGDREGTYAEPNEIKIKINVVKKPFAQKNFNEGRKIEQKIPEFEKNFPVNNLPHANLRKKYLEQQEIFQQENLPLSDLSRKYFEEQAKRNNEKNRNIQFVNEPSANSNFAYSTATPDNSQLAEIDEESFSQEAERESVQELKRNLALKFVAFKEIIQEAFNPKLKKALAYSSMIALVLLILPMSIIFLRGMREKKSIEGLGAAGYGNLKEAQASIEQIDVGRAGKNFELAYSNFLEARKKLEEVGGIPARILKFVPGISKIESGKKLAQTGECFSLAGGEIIQAMSLIIDRREDLKNNLFVGLGEDNLDPEMSLTDMVVLLSEKLKSAKGYLDEASQLSQEIDLNDFSKEEREDVIMLQGALPEIIEGLDEFSQYTEVFLEILGQNGGRKYLMLFQNNHEVRATGGFIGTYGIIKINQGILENIKVEGIYDPDGQLKEKIIPPKPIQKMSATWSMHDSNWWPDFPTSAEKTSWFYEKTGGPTVDGVISFTPQVIQELLGVVGSIRVEGYGSEGSLLVTQDNFMEEVQYQVEIDYDKEENKPKKILADLTPLVINEIFSAPPEDWPAILGIFSKALQEKSLLLYSFDSDIQKLVSKMGWSGEILNTTKDYLSVINTNISGLKTDGVIKQKIIHQAEIQEDGSIIDTVTIKRKHEGGHEIYDWSNATNCNWLRVYVPENSELISSSGFTREFVDPPLDYDKLGFKEDFQVKQMEESYQIDEDSTTRIYKEKGKTVFANWVYVSPGETVTVSFKYLLPFRVDLDNVRKPADSYSLLVQKQSGSENVELESQLTGLEGCEYIYSHPSNLNINQGGWSISEHLATDKFFALVLKKK